MKYAIRALAFIFPIFANVWGGAFTATAAETCHFESSTASVGSAVDIKGWVTSGVACGRRFNGGMKDDMQISTQPQHGKAVIDKAHSAVVYQSEKGYRGPDSYTVWISIPFRNSAIWFTYDFDVSERPRTEIIARPAPRNRVRRL
jgi:hypothetical protein